MVDPALINAQYASQSASRTWLDVTERNQAEEQVRALNAELEQRVIERDRAEMALRESELRLQTVVNNAPVVLLAVDRPGIYTLFDGHGLKALGLDPGQLIGTSALAPLPGALSLAPDIRRALAGASFTNLMEPLPDQGWKPYGRR